MICKNTEAHRKTHLLLTISFPFLRHAEWFSAAQKRRAKKTKQKRHCGICCVLGCAFYLRYTWSEVIFAPKSIQNAFERHWKRRDKKGYAIYDDKLIPRFFLFLILDLCTRPSREHHPWQFVLIYSRLKQDINKAGVLGSTCPLRAVCQSRRGNIWAPERCLIMLAVCWRDSLVDIANPELQAKTKVVRTKVQDNTAKRKIETDNQIWCSRNIYVLLWYILFHFLDE